MSETLYHIAFMSLPNLLAIFVAIGLFCSLYPLRAHAPQRLTAAALACLALACASGALHRLLVPLVAAAAGRVVANALTPAFFTLVLLLCLPLARFACEMSWWDALFCCASGYSLQNFSHAVWGTLSVLVLGTGTPVGPLAGALQLLISGLVFAAGYLAVIRHIRTNHLAGAGDWRMALLLVGVILVNILLDNMIQNLQESSAIGALPFLVLRLTQLFSSALLLALDYEILYSNRMRANVAATRQLIEDQRRQYEVSRETIEAINVRCHDIRHQVRHLTNRPEDGGEFLRSVSDLISVYDANVRTGNDALDVILTEKSVLCQSRGIALTCTADGAALSFMAEQDVYSLFGNALDNAIDAVEGIGDPERRLIDVTTRQTGRAVCVQVRNFYEGELSFRDGLPETTHEGPLHGYGMKSLRLIAERYGGELTVSAENGMFRLFVLLPRP